MSNIYIQEPPTQGKVLLKTTVGDIDVELWSKEAPKACRNFVQLCLEGYYDNTIFHRVVPNFIVQGGDPTESGEGGESVYGAPFKDEFHSRLRFVRRGLVAMANGGPNDNGSQFFFTMRDTPELQNKHTIFGKVAGDTVFNMLKLQEVEVGANERPLEPHKILHIEVLSNPFDDIIPRQLSQLKRLKKEKEEDKKIKSKSRATKNFCLLSFGEEAQEDEEQVDKATESFRGKSKSSHDLTDDPRLSSVPAVEREMSEEKKKPEVPAEEAKKKAEPSEEDAKSTKSETEDTKKKKTESSEDEAKKKTESGEDSKKKKDDVTEEEKKKRRSDPVENDGKKKKSENAGSETENDGAKKRKTEGEEEKKKVKVEEKDDRGKKRKTDQQQEVADESKKRKKTEETSDDKKRKRKEDTVEDDRRKRKVDEQDQDSRRKRKPEEEKEEGKKKKKPEEETEGGPRPSEEQRSIKEDVRKKLKKEREDSPKAKEVKPVPEVPEDTKKSTSTRMEELKKEAKRLQKDIKDSKKRTEEKEETKVPKTDETEKIIKKEDEEDTSEENDLLAMVKNEREKYKSRKRLLEKKEDREANTLALLAKFQNRLTTIKTVAGDYDDEEEDKDKEEEDFSDFSWMRHRLHFEDEVQKTKVLDANVQESDRYELSDPRNPMTQRRRENSKKAMRSKR